MCSAQVFYDELFDDYGPTVGSDHTPIELIGRGWEFSNQSEPLGWSHGKQRSNRR